MDGNIRKFLKVLSIHDNLVTEFDEDFWHITVDNVTVNSDGRYSFAFKDGRTVELG
jgi:hypothetical protein